MKLNTKQLSIGGAILIVLFLVTSLLIAYLSNSRDKLSQSFKKLYPAALVGGKPVSIEDTEDFLDLVKKTDSSTTPSSAFETFINHQKSEVLMKNLGIKLPSDAVSDELAFYTKGNEQVFDQLLQTYFNNDKKLFTEDIVYPQVVEAALKIKYNLDYSLNSAAYQKTEGILEQLNQGQKFEDLAKQFSDDKESSQFGGDLGFVSHGQLLPELEKEIAVAKTGVVHDLIVTRDGYEIVIPIEVADQNGVKMWHAKHILIQTSGFEQWLTNQTRNISVKTFKKY